MRKTYGLILIAIMLITFTACSMLKGASKDLKDGYKFEEAWSIGFLVPSYQYKKVSKCKVVEGVTVEPCVVISPADGFTLDTSSPFGPSALDAVGSIATGAIISEGLRSSNNSNSTSTNINTNTLSGESGGGCRGNCRHDD